MKNQKLRRLLRAAVIAAIYVALCFLFAPISYGPVQVRLAEALTLLPVLCPEAIAGVTIGCFLANMLSGLPLDMVIGTAATLLAALCSYGLRRLRWRGLPVAASLPPVLFNAVIIGAEISYLSGAAAPVWAFNMLTVGAGQLVSCCGLGLLLVWAIERNDSLRSWFTGNALPPG